MLLVNKKFPIAKSIDLMQMYYEYTGRRYKLDGKSLINNFLSYIKKQPLLIKRRTYGDGYIVVPNGLYKLVFIMKDGRIDSRRASEMTDLQFLDLRLFNRTDLPELPELMVHVINNELVLDELKNYVKDFNDSQVAMRGMFEDMIRY